MTRMDFNDLTPDMVLDALESLGLYSDGRLLALNSYENRVYQVGIDGEAPVIVKFYRPGRWTDEAIGEEHALIAALAEEEIPAVPAIRWPLGHTVCHHAGFRFAVFPRQGGRAPELDDPDTLEWLGRFIGRIHAVGKRSAFHHRPTLDIASFGEEPFAWLLGSGLIPKDLLASYESTVRHALDAVRRCYDRAGDVTHLRLHGDCHVGNVLWTDAGPHFVDFDDSRMGPAVQDLWMLLSGERRDMLGQLSDLLAGYEQFADFNPRELFLVEGLRTLRMIHYAAWLARRKDDPAFVSAFTWFGTQQYWQEHILQLREQLSVMDEPPLMPLA